MTLPALAAIDRSRARAFLDASPTRADVESAFRWVIGRDPRSDAEIDRLMATYASRRALRTWLIASKGALHAQLISRFGAEKWVLAEVFDNLRIWLNLCDRHVSMGALVGTWEPEETAFMRRTLKAGQVVVDVGANIGWFTLLARACVGPSGRVHAFEPQKRVFAYLARTVAENRMLGEILPYPMALGQAWGTQRLACHPNSANMGHAWLGPAAGAGREAGDDAGDLGEVTVGVLDDIMGEAAVDFIKIDAEGAEGLVLRGARRILTTRRPTVMVEITPAFLHRVSGGAAQDIFELFSAADYQGYQIGPDGHDVMVSRWPEDLATANLCFRPR